jgi:hypothetical protein
MTLKPKLMLIILMLYVVTKAGGQAIVAPVEKDVALAGEIREVHGYGPPGYGEDKKERLELPIGF